MIEATIPHLSPPVSAMVRLQLLTGARPGEICIMRGRDVQVHDDVWIYRPAQHKTEHHGHQRQAPAAKAPSPQDAAQPRQSAGVAAESRRAAQARRTLHGLHVPPRDRPRLRRGVSVARSTGAPEPRDEPGVENAPDGRATGCGCELAPRPSMAPASTAAQRGHHAPQGVWNRCGTDDFGTQARICDYGALRRSQRRPCDGSD